MRTIKFLLIVAVALALSACAVPAAPQAEPAAGGGEVAATAQPAEEPGKLVVYSSVDEENARKLLDAFSADTGVDVEMIFLSSGPALSRIEAEANRPQADIWFGAPSENHIVAKERGLTQPYNSPEAANLDDQFKDAEGYWHAFYMNPLGFGVRTDALQERGLEPPTSWKSLADPAYAGLIQMPSPQSSGTAYAIVMTLVTIFGEDEAFNLMKAINPNVQTYTQSGTAPGKALAIGETVIGIQFTPAFLKLIDEGYPVTLIIPEEGVGYEAAAMSIIKDAPHAETAQKLVDWMLSKAGQEQLSAQKTYFFPVRSDVSAGEGVPELASIKLIPYDLEYAAANKERLVNRWVEEVLGQ
ncbi:MAG: ABC transporter substrate-binding protein [Chloroflexi bacterium]|nr:ABC transporter substrate-binding protein [Chloroflexota bacterium]